MELSNSRALARAGIGAVIDNTSGDSREGAGILSLKPGTAERGKAHTIQIELNAEAGRGRVPSGVPSRVVIGPFEGAKIEREGNTITCQIAIPTDANRAALHDCHLEFDASGRNGITVIKKNNAFRVGGE